MRVEERRTEWRDREVALPTIAWILDPLKQPALHEVQHEVTGGAGAQPELFREFGDRQGAVTPHPREGDGVLKREPTPLCRLNKVLRGVQTVDQPDHHVGGFSGSAARHKSPVERNSDRAARSAAISLRTTAIRAASNPSRASERSKAVIPPSA